MLHARDPITSHPASAAVSGTTTTRARRVLGVDVARGAALVGMVAVHTFPLLDEDGEPTAATLVAGGRSAATFVLVAGVGLAFLSGGRAVVQGRDRVAVAAGLTVRAVLIGALGLALGLLAELNGIDGILPFYALLFLLAIPLLGLPPRVLAGVAAALIALGPVLIVATADLGLPAAEADPTPATLVEDPVGLLVQLSVTGEYPIVVYLAYLCAGLAIGRLDLHSRRVAWWLVGAGAALAVAARVVSAVVLYPLGGLARLISRTGSDDDPGEVVQELLWEPELVASWWYLALPAPHSHTPVDVAHTLGSAMVVLGAALLLTRIGAIARLLRPLGMAGGMALTLYAAHLVVLATAVPADDPALLFLLMVTVVLAFAVLWGRWLGQGPLELIVAGAAGRARRTTADLLRTRGSRGSGG